jgi:hypothetical protein
MIQALNHTCMVASVMEFYYLTLNVKVHEFNAYLLCYCQILTVEDNKVGLLFHMKFYCHLTWNTKKFQHSETCHKCKGINVVTFIIQKYGILIHLVLHSWQPDFNSGIRVLKKTAYRKLNCAYTLLQYFNANPKKVTKYEDSPKDLTYIKYSHFRKIRHAA